MLNKTTYAYDSNGNLTQKAQGGNITNYTYDSQNRLVQVSDKDNNPIARYGYDPFDRRIWKEAYRTKDGAPLSQPTRSYYLYADEGLIGESQQPLTLPLSLIDSGGEGGGEGVSGAGDVTATTEPTITTQYGPRPNDEFTTATLFVKTKNSAGQNTIAYYHHDHLGTPIQATDRSGIIVWSAQYNAFGNVNITTPTATDDKPVIESNLRFPGQLEDVETGLYYNWHRYYDPEVGRYLTADPIGLDGGINFYAYVGGNPVNWIDPKGKNVGAPDDGTCDWRCQIYRIIEPPEKPEPHKSEPIPEPVPDVVKVPDLTDMTPEEYEAELAKHGFVRKKDRGRYKEWVSPDGSIISIDSATCRVARIGPVPPSRTRGGPRYNPDGTKQPYNPGGPNTHDTGERVKGCC